MIRRYLVPVGAFVLSACGAPIEETGSVNGASVCNALTNEAPIVTETAVGAAFPQTTARGGVLEPGKYFLTAFNVYTGAGGPSGQYATNRRQTVLITSEGDLVYLIQSAIAYNGGLDEDVTQRVMLSSRPTGDSSVLCPRRADGPFDYSVDGDTYSVYSPAESTVQVFTRQPLPEE